VVRTLLRGRGAGEGWLDRVHANVFGDNARAVYGLQTAAPVEAAEGRSTVG
jgi:hypothetical protein